MILRRERERERERDRETERETERDRERERENTQLYYSELQNILDSNYKRIGLSICGKFSLGK